MVTLSRRARSPRKGLSRRGVRVEGAELVDKLTDRISPCRRSLGRAQRAVNRDCPLDVSGTHVDDE